MNAHAAIQGLYRSLPQLDEFEEESKLADRPRLAGVYLLLRGDKVVYVGQSKHLRNRIAQHRQDGEKDFSTFLFYPLEDTESRLCIEGVLILLLRPEYNRGLNLGLAAGRVWAIQWRRGVR